jgi:hypothetical protein
MEMIELMALIRPETISLAALSFLMAWHCLWTRPTYANMTILVIKGRQSRWILVMASQHVEQLCGRK